VTNRAAVIPEEPSTRVRESGERSDLHAFKPPFSM